MKYRLFKLTGLMLSFTLATLLADAALAQPALPQGDPESAGMSSARLVV